VDEKQLTTVVWWLKKGRINNCVVQGEVSDCMVHRCVSTIVWSTYCERPSGAQLQQSTQKVAGMLIQHCIREYSAVDDPLVITR
jgi:hypothetical protein